ncbi:MAG: helicase-related protein, partial [Dehalococcoidia bacterium]|nr:helicase-related protein [Dehalococcoidia bacterium]
CLAFAPTEDLGTGKLAQCPVEAYKRYGEGRLAFCFVSYVEQAGDVAAAFVEAGVAAEVIHGETNGRDRKEILWRFKAGETRVLVNVYTMTEGIDVPQASCCILARNVGHVSTYLQMCGRILRPSDGKADAVLIDLAGAVHRHGLPTEDRVYSLTGEAMSVKRERSLTVCRTCGYTLVSGPPQCPRCGAELGRKIQLPRIYDFELKAVFAGSQTPLEARERECQRLCRLADEKGWSASWVATEYGKLFGAPPPTAWLDREKLKAEFVRLVNLGREKGYKPGFAKARFQAVFGSWGPR